MIMLLSIVLGVAFVLAGGQAWLLNRLVQMNKDLQTEVSYAWSCYNKKSDELGSTKWELDAAYISLQAVIEHDEKEIERLSQAVEMVLADAS